VVAADKAEFFFKQQKERYAAGAKSLRPDCYTYTCVMNAWAQAGKPERAESILREMYEDFAANGNTSAAPNANSFNSTYFHAYILLIYQEGFYFLMSNIFLIQCTALIKAWAMSNRSNSTMMAEEVLEQMIYLSATLPSVAPTIRTFQTMIMCYGRSETSNNPQRADELFQQVLDLHAKGKIKDAPDKKLYLTLRVTWSVSSAKNKAKRIFEINSAIKEKFHS
jgi:pentatricopeptide repeat protein